MTKADEIARLSVMGQRLFKAQTDKFKLLQEFTNNANAVLEKKRQKTTTPGFYRDAEAVYQIIEELSGALHVLALESQSIVDQFKS